LRKEDRPHGWEEKKRRKREIVDLYLTPSSLRGKWGKKKGRKKMRRLRGSSLFRHSHSRSRKGGKGRKK